MDNLMMAGFGLTVGVMVILICMVSFAFMIVYKLKQKVKVNQYVKIMIVVGFVIGALLIVVSYRGLDLKALGF
ncbi:MAG: hypothetical protein MR593_12530 [Intestinibacter sp.]|uniref:hypothetical protein n=1 Tax=Intestinibacter sp. TaxID=1965304 RepID=UPI0025BEF9F8|nr:hypothetical protein [Intestinibacter sp.]MCI6738933.1 hypothetical protein [Intestinibacter sp.]